MQQEMKMLLDRLEDAQSSRTDSYIVSDVLLRLSELLEIEGHDVASRCAQQLSADTKGATGGSLRNHLGAEDTDEVLKKKWVAVPDSMDSDEAATVLENYAAGRLTYSDEKPA